MNYKEKQKILAIFESYEEQNIKLALLLAKSNNITSDIFSEYIELVEFLGKYGRLNLNEDFETNILNLLNLEFLSIPYFKLKSLPNKISFLINLETLNLDHNDFEKIPENICNLPKLKNLSLSFNKLSELPNKLDKLMALENLDLSSNKLERMPFCIGNFRKLNTLCLQNNPLPKGQTGWLSNHYPNCIVKY